jgi:hypothetical protein
LAFLVWIDRLAFKLVGCPHDGGYVVCNVPKGLACDLTSQIEAVSTPTLRANEAPSPVEVVPPKTVSPAAHWARAVLVDEVASVDPKGNEQVPPITFRYRPDMAHGLGGSGKCIQ